MTTIDGRRQGHRTEQRRSCRGIDEFCANRIRPTTKSTTHTKKMLLQARNARDGREGVAGRSFTIVLCEGGRRKEERRKRRGEERSSGGEVRRRWCKCKCEQVQVIQGSGPNMTRHDTTHDTTRDGANQNPSKRRDGNQAIRFFFPFPSVPGKSQ